MRQKKIYLQSEISKDKTQLYQFSEEDTLMLLEKIFGHHKSIKFSEEDTLMLLEKIFGHHKSIKLSK